MDIKNTLAELIQYYTLTRRIGHTVAMMKGAENAGPVFVMGATAHHALTLANGHANIKPVSPGEFFTKTVGYRLPLLIDNFALVNIFADAHHRIIELEYKAAECERLKLDNERLYIRIAKLQDENRGLRARTIGRMLRDWLCAKIGGQHGNE